MIVLSLFDGISCAQVALQRAGIKYDKYFACEIEKNSVAVTQKHFPDTIQLGNVEFINAKELPEIWLLIGGSPCQSLSSAAGQKESGLVEGASTLFWEYARILNEVKPKYFLLENVASMKKADRDIISKTLGVEPIMINSSLVSGQMRKRLYWTNIKGIQQPENKHIYLKDVLIGGGYTEKEKAYCITATTGNTVPNDYFLKQQRQMVFNKPVRIGTIGKSGQSGRIYDINGKSVCLSANGGGRGAKTGLYYIIDDKVIDGKDLQVLKPYVRKLYPVECERLQTLEDNFTDGFSNTARYKMIGNGFTVDVIAHILSYIKN